MSVHPSSPHRRHRAVAVLTATFALLVSGCGGGAATSPPPPPPLLLSAPRTHIVVTIPDGWHQVINSANPAIGEMVSPTTCMGDAEVTCALGLARIATLGAPDAPAAARIIYQAIVGGPGITAGPNQSDGPGRVGAHDGYRHRFTFSNTNATLTTEIAAVASGSPATDAQGNREFSVVMVWVADRPGAPPATVLDQIISSARVAVAPPPPN